MLTLSAIDLHCNIIQLYIYTGNSILFVMVNSKLFFFFFWQICNKYLSEIVTDLTYRNKLINTVSKWYVMDLGFLVTIG